MKKKNEILSFATAWMALEVIMLSEISQRQKDKHCMFSLNLWVVKIKAIELMDTENRRFVIQRLGRIVAGGGAGGGDGR